MPNSLNINFAEARATGNKLISNGGDFGYLIGKVRGANTTLKGNGWDDAASVKYFEKVEEQAIYANKLADCIKEIGQFLIKAADAYEAAVEANKIAG